MNNTLPGFTWGWVARGCQFVVSQTILGGEARSCYVETVDEQLDLPIVPELVVNHGKIQYTCFVLTPLTLAQPPESDNKIEGSSGIVNSGFRPTRCKSRCSLSSTSRQLIHL